MNTKELFPKLSLEEKRRLLNLTEWYLQGVLSARKGQVKIVNVDRKADFLDKLDDDEIMEAIELARLSQKGEKATNPKEALRIFKQSGGHPQAGVRRDKRQRHFCFLSRPPLRSA